MNCQFSNQQECCNAQVFIPYASPTTLAMLTEDKVTEFICVANDFCPFFDAQMAKYTLESIPIIRVTTNLCECY